MVSALFESRLYRIPTRLYYPANSLPLSVLALLVHPSLAKVVAAAPRIRLETLLLPIESVVLRKDIANPGAADTRSALCVC